MATRAELVDELQKAKTSLTGLDGDLVGIDIQINALQAQKQSLLQQKAALEKRIQEIEEELNSMAPPVIVTFDLWNLDTKKYVTWISGDTIDLKGLPSKVGFGIPTKNVTKIQYNVNGNTGEMTETFPNFFLIPVPLSTGPYKITVIPEGGGPVTRQYNIINSGSTSGPEVPTDPKPIPPAPEEPSDPIQDNFPTTVNTVPFRAVHFRAPDSFLNGPDPQNSDPRWTHSGTEDERLMPKEYVGFAGAACYSKAGEYGVYFKGAPFAKVVVKETRKPVEAKTLTQLKNAVAMKNTIVLFNPASNLVEISQPLQLADGVHLKTTKSNLTLLGTYKTQWQAMFYPGENVTLEGFTLDHKDGDDPNLKIAKDGIAGNDSLTVLNMNVADIGTFVNANTKPNGIFVAGCTENTNRSIRRYFIWGEGTNIFVTRNTITNSTREHVIRCSGDMQNGDPTTKFITIVENELGNEDLRDIDPGDYSKGAVTIQAAMWVSIFNNTMIGPAALGPLGEADGMNHPNHRGKYAIYQKNKNTHQAFMRINHGQHHTLIKDNIFESTYHSSGDLDLHVQGWFPEYQRGTEDIVIDGNTGDIRIDDSVKGRLIVKNHNGTIKYGDKMVPSINFVSKEPVVTK